MQTRNALAAGEMYASLGCTEHMRRARRNGYAALSCSGRESMLKFCIILTGTQTNSKIMAQMLLFRSIFLPQVTSYKLPGSEFRVGYIYLRYSGMVISKVSGETENDIHQL